MTAVSKTAQCGFESHQEDCLASWPLGEIGIRRGFKIPCPEGRVGSSPTGATKLANAAVHSKQEESSKMKIIIDNQVFEIKENVWVWVNAALFFAVICSFILLLLSLFF